ncbi:hypothetical protein SAMN05421874_11468 [Nonomuraea maritima]|uniref:Uncharacterized protein n=1 Tax=Nonomuraea maritima TaxID=683260 RepID=A0A1G9GH90_9ACTN|nr:hypothetical protein SAMN05421874_11468 [Nonomuraea maritima]
MGLPELLFLVLQLAVIFGVVYFAVRLALRHDRKSNDSGQ